MCDICRELGLEEEKQEGNADKALTSFLAMLGLEAGKDEQVGEFYVSSLKNQGVWETGVFKTNPDESLEGVMGILTEGVHREVWASKEECEAGHDRIVKALQDGTFEPNGEMGPA